MFFQTKKGVIFMPVQFWVNLIYGLAAFTIVIAIVYTAIDQYFKMKYEYKLKLIKLFAEIAKRIDINKFAENLRKVTDDNEN